MSWFNNAAAAAKWAVEHPSDIGHFAKNATVGAASAAVKLVGAEDSLNLQLPHYNRKSFAEKNNSDWMSEIKDEMPLWALTIPGTHDTCARFGGDLVECQSLELPAQLEAGIRFLDIRTRHYNNTLPIHHGIVFQNKSFTSVLEDVANFLRNHPRECVLMQVQREYDSAGNTTEFDQLVQSVCHGFADILPSPGPDGPFTNPATATLGQLRGKLVVLQNYDASAHVQGAVPRYSWVDQNNWDLGMGEIESVKIPQIISHFQATRAQEGALRRNWLSAASASAWPHGVAKLTNLAALEYLRSQEPHPVGFGVLVCDFPGTELIDQCIRHSRGTAHARLGA